MSFNHEPALTYPRFRSSEPLQPPILQGQVVLPGERQACSAGAGRARLAPRRPRPWPRTWRRGRPRIGTTTRGVGVTTAAWSALNPTARKVEARGGTRTVVTAEPLEALYPPMVMSPDRQPHGGRPSRPRIPSTSGLGALGGAACRRTAAAASAHDDPRLGDGSPRRPTGAGPGTPAGGYSPRRAGFLTAVVDGVQLPVPLPMARWTWRSPAAMALARLEQQAAV
jgi:hypothetical protein